MWEWLLGPKFQRRPLSEAEEAFVRRMLQGDSPQLRALRGQLDSLRETGTSIAIGAKSLHIQFNHAVPHLWLPFLDPIQINWNVKSAAGKVSVSLTVQGGLKEIVVSAVNSAALGDLETLLSNIELTPIDHSRLGPPDEALRSGWEATFGDYLQRELSIADQESAAPECRFLIPTRGDSSAALDELGPALRGPVIEAFRDMLRHSNGVNFFGVHLGVPGTCDFTSDVMIVSDLLVAEPVFHRISILEEDGRCAFFKGPYDERPEPYADSLQELFAKLYDDIESGRVVGSQF